MENLLQRFGLIGCSSCACSKRIQQLRRIGVVETKAQADLRSPSCSNSTGDTIRNPIVAKWFGPTDRPAKLPIAGQPNSLCFNGLPQPS